MKFYLEMAAGHILGRPPSQASPQSLLMHSRASSNSSGSNVPTYSAASANDSGTEAGRSSFSRRQAVCHSRPPRTSRSSLQYIGEFILRALNIYTEKHVGLRGASDSIIEVCRCCNSSAQMSLTPSCLGAENISQSEEIDKECMR